MANFRALIIAGGALLALTRVASAADLLPPPPALEPLPPAPVEFNGWYLRGDLGLGFNASAPSMAVSPDPLPAALLVDAGANNNFYNPTISASGIFDLGFGYQFNAWLRGDITEEFRGGSSFQTLEVLNEPNVGSQFADFYRGNLSSYITMVNGYADLGTWYGVTPYVGLGGGLAYNKLFGMTDTGFAAVGGNPPGPVGGYLDDGGKWSFAWAAMLGLSFDVTQNLKLDIGYRYLDYGRFTSGVSHCLNGTGGGSGFNCQGYTVYSKSELASNDLRIGLRWMLDTQAPTPAPMVRAKY